MWNYMRLNKLCLVTFIYVFFLNTTIVSRLLLTYDIETLYV